MAAMSEREEPRTAAGRDLVSDLLARFRAPSHSLLTEYVLAIEREAADEWEVFTASDGHRGLRMREAARPEIDVDDERAVATLVAHQRRDAGSCLCGWDKWGASHAEHVWRMLKLAFLQPSEGAEK